MDAPKDSPGTWLFRLLRIGATGYVALVLLLVFAETRFVYPGAGSSLTPLPGEAEGFRWDTTRVAPNPGPPVFLLSIPASDSPREAPWVLFFHGNGELLGTAGSVGRFRLLHELGFNILAMEFRGYGIADSSGPPSEDGIYRDAKVAWEHLTQSRSIEPERILIYGWSLGSGVAVQLAATVEPAGLVTEAAFTSVPDAARRLMPFLPTGLLMRNRYESIDRAAEIEEPWLLLHGRNDVQIPFSHAEALAAQASRPRLVPLDAGHNDGVTAAWSTASRALEEFARELFRWEDPPKRDLRLPQ